MAIVRLGTAPTFTGKANYANYREWLLEHFFDHLCSYCFLRDDSVEIDHYEPVGYAPGRAHDPTNLLLGCGRCNGRAGKSDYHPAHGERTRLPKDTTGHLIIDVRTDDFAQIFEVRGDGEISARPGATADRASWNIATLKLGLPLCTERRRELQSLLLACETMCKKAAESQDRTCETVLDRLLPHLAAYRLFFDVFGLPISVELRRRLEAQSATT